MLPPEKYALKLLSLCLLTFVLVMSLSACTTKPPTISSVNYQENLLKKCSTDIPRLAGTTGRDISEPLEKMAILYGQCAARHNQLTDEIRKRKELSHD